MTVNDDGVQIIDSVPAWTLEEGDQIVVNGDLVILGHITDTDEDNQIILSGENLSDVAGDDSWTIDADTVIDIWSV